MATEAKNPVTGSFTGTGTSDAFTTRGEFNIAVTGFGTATVEVQRSFDEGSTWLTLTSYTADAHKRAYEPGYSVLWRFECISHGGGTIAYIMST